jgi:hypothetical protein
MTSGQIAVLIVIALVVAAGAVAVWYYQRRTMLRSRFGPEYDRVVADQDGRAAGERELLDRERRHSGLELRPLELAVRERYVDHWRAVQAQFLEDPARAVVLGDEIVTRLVAERGYPTENYDDQLSYLSVEHAQTLSHYRDAHAIYLRGQRGEASTEELRQALVHYRELFTELLGDSSLTATHHDSAAHDSAAHDTATHDTATHETTQR